MTSIVQALYLQVMSNEPSNASHKLVNQLYQEIVSYGVVINKAQVNYVKRCFLQAFLAGKIEGLEVSLKIQHDKSTN